MLNWKSGLFFGLLPTMTEEQIKYVDSIFNNQLTIVNAKSGTGKTTLAVGAAKMIGKPLLYTFNPTQEAKLGFLPGDIAAKEAEYLQPLKDALLKINENPSQAIFAEPSPSAKFSKSSWVIAKSHTFARGINIENMTVIIDEAQNWTLDQLKKMLTRIHDSCTVIVIGHIGQCDLLDIKNSGFPRLMEHFSTIEYAELCPLNKNFRGQLAQDADEM